MPDLKLSKQLGALYARLEGRGDVPIGELCMILGLDPGATSRTTQQVVGPYVVRLNRKLREHDLIVVPGQLKRTYALTRISALAS
jgi:hypothetical protein